MKRRYTTGKARKDGEGVALARERIAKAVRTGKPEALRDALQAWLLPVTEGESTERRP